MATKVMYSTRQCQKFIKSVTIRHFLMNSAVHNRTVCCNQYLRQYSTAENDAGMQLSEQEAAEEQERELEIQAKRDISRLPDAIKRRLEHSLDVPDLNLHHRKPQRHMRKLYSYYGAASGIDANVAWPTQEELEEELEFEREFEPSLEERWTTLKAKKDAELAERQAKEAHVKKQMARMPEYIAQFKKRLAKADEAEHKQELKRKALIEEARDYFGFHIDPRDPRFKQMVEEKAERDLKLKKEKKKEEKGMRIAANLKRLQAEAEKVKQKEQVQP